MSSTWIIKQCSVLFSCCSHPSGYLVKHLICSVLPLLLLGFSAAPTPLLGALRVFVAICWRRSCICDFNRDLFIGSGHCHRNRLRLFCRIFFFFRLLGWLIAMNRFDDDDDGEEEEEEEEEEELEEEEEEEEGRRRRRRRRREGCFVDDDYDEDFLLFFSKEGSSTARGNCGEIVVCLLLT